MKFCEKTCIRIWLDKILFIMTRSSGVNVLTNGPKMSDLTKRGIFQLSSSQIDETKNMHSLRYQQCLGRLNKLTDERCSEKGPFRRLSKHAFQTQEYRQYLACKAKLCFQNVYNFKFISETQ